MRWAATVEERFWAKVDRSGGPEACWPWTGAHVPLGYGTFWMDGGYQRAPRVALLLSLGRPVPAHMDVLHRCDNPPCVNPAHLFEGNHQTNMRDMRAKRRDGWTTHPELVARRGEQNGNARLTEAEVLEVRRLRDCGWSLSFIAGAFGITKQAVAAIVKGKNWKWLQAA